MVAGSPVKYKLVIFSSEKPLHVVTAPSNLANKTQNFDFTTIPPNQASSDVNTSDGSSYPT